MFQIHSRDGYLGEYVTSERNDKYHPDTITHYVYKRLKDGKIRRIHVTQATREYYLR